MTMRVPPRASKRPTTTTWHGKVNIDNYAWLRDDDWQKVMRDPNLLNLEIRAYLEAENKFTSAVMEPLSGEVEALFAEMKGRVKEDDSSVPLPDGDWSYYRRFREGGQHPLFCRQPRDGGDEQILFDGDKAAKGASYFKLGAFDHSPDHRLAAYAVDVNGSEIFTIRFCDLNSGDDLPDVITDTNGGLVWSADGQTILYTVLDDNHRPHAVRLHHLGSDTQNDPWIYQERDPGFFVGISATGSRRFFVISAYDHQTSEAYLIPTDAPKTAPKLVAPRIVGTEYEVSEQGHRFLIRTNADKAEDFKVMSAPIDAPGRENWTEQTAHEAGRLILSVGTFKDYWIRMERVDALPRLVITGPDGAEHAIAFDEEAYALALNGSYEYDTTIVRFTYSSMTTPERVYDYDMESRQRELRKEQEVPSGHDPDNYITGRLNMPAEDGELVPVSILYRKGTPLDGSAPLLLYGYGAYGMSMPASFGTPRLSLVDRGFIYAIAHIRGGMEKGYRWYRGGRMDNKKNSFADFITVAEGLISERLSSAGRIVAHGGSAGGMLMGTVANLRPDLFGAVLADVPFVDVLNTMLDDALPLTPPEWQEWGNPIEYPEAYNYIRSYSPYDNVASKDYPNIFVTAGLTDPRVTYWEPAKWVAKLRELKTDNNTICLKTNMDAGHGGASGRFNRLRETAELYAFVLSVL